MTTHSWLTLPKLTHVQKLVVWSDNYIYIMEITGYLESDTAARRGGCNEKLVSETRTKELFQMLSDASAGLEQRSAGLLDGWVILQTLQ